MRSVIKFASLVAAFFCASTVWANNPGVVQGVVKSAAGQPVAGAYVKLTNAEKGLTIMVVSQEQGRYTVSNLLVGKYTAQAIGGEFQSKPCFSAARISSRNFCGIFCRLAISAILTGSPELCSARSKMACKAYSPFTEMCISAG